MKLDKPVLAIAAGFFLLWLCVLYKGADHPPPLGFSWLVLLDLIASGLLYLRVRTYADWHAVRRPHRVLLVLRDGALTGLAFGMATMLFTVARLGNVVAKGWEPALIWLTVLTLVGHPDRGARVCLHCAGGGTRPKQRLAGAADPDSPFLHYGEIGRRRIKVALP